MSSMRSYRLQNRKRRNKDGAIFIANNLLLFVVPVICWIYMTIFLIKTEEVWLKDLYGQEYIDYCQRVNRCIPRMPKKR